MEMALNAFNPNPNGRFGLNGALDSSDGFAITDCELSNVNVACGRLRAFFIEFLVTQVSAKDISTFPSSNHLDILDMDK